LKEPSPTATTALESTDEEAQEHLRPYVGQA
jgi:hypothetical protein